MAQFNREYRNKLDEVVKALPRDRHGRISPADHDALLRQAKADKAAGFITHSDFFNASCVLGSAVNLPA